MGTGKLSSRFFLRAESYYNVATESERLGPEQTLIFVSHYPEEIPQSVHRFLQLDAGRVVAIR